MFLCPSRLDMVLMFTPLIYGNVFTVLIFNQIVGMSEFSKAMAIRRERAHILSAHCGGELQNAVHEIMKVAGPHIDVVIKAGRNILGERYIQIAEITGFCRENGKGH